jgi:hypothetical protein
MTCSRVPKSVARGQAAEPAHGGITSPAARRGHTATFELIELIMSYRKDHRRRRSKPRSAGSRGVRGGSTSDEEQFQHELRVTFHPQKAERPSRAHHPNNSPTTIPHAIISLIHRELQV